jgi:DNA-binding response OmpR family regulator
MHIFHTLIHNLYVNYDTILQILHHFDRLLIYNISTGGISVDNKTALIIEDDAHIAGLLRMYMEKDGFSVRVSGDGEEGLRLFKEAPPDIVLLDLMLPGLDGRGVCRGIRAVSAVPVIMITAKTETLDKVQGLEMGADDYIGKPFDMQEVMARVRAVLRRSSSSALPRRLTFDNLTVDMDSFTVSVNGRAVDAPPKELELLYHLASSPNRVFTRNQLLDEVWGFDYFGDSRTVDVHIKRLREKLEGASDKWSLKTVWGVGYKFESLT